MENIEGGTVILLNGASSAGKTSLAKCLQAIMDGPYLHVPVDSFAAMAPGPEKVGEPGSPEWQAAFNRLLTGFHRSLAALAGAGNNLIVDHVLVQGVEPEWWLRECVEALTPFRAYLVGVHCPLAELQRREQARGDRNAGLAEFQWSRVHRHGVYDLEVDTSVLSPEQCALAVKEMVEREGEPQALASLRALLSRGLP